MGSFFVCGSSFQILAKGLLAFLVQRGGKCMTDLGKDMGTRHRACLGIAENSDAIAIVVSEETGIISMAKNGVLIRHFDRQTLYTRLVDEMIPKETTVEKSTADTWKDRVKSVWNWVSQKGDEQQ